MANSRRKVSLNYLRDTTLAHITTGNGYNQTIGTIKRGLEQIDKLPVSGFPALYITRTTEDRNNLTRNKFFGDIFVYVVGYVKNATGTTGVMEQIDDLVEDVCKAFERDRTLGGNVHWIEVTSVMTDDGDMMPYGACVITCRLKYAAEGATQQ